MEPLNKLDPKFTAAPQTVPDRCLPRDVISSGNETCPLLNEMFPETFPGGKSHDFLLPRATASIKTSSSDALPELRIDEVKDPVRLARILRADFRRIDVNSDGGLSKAELDEFSRRRDIAPSERGAATFLSKNYKDFSALATNVHADDVLPLNSTKADDKLYNQYFFDQHKEGISLKDIDTFSLILDPKAFQAQLRDVRGRERIQGVGGVVFGACALGFGAAAIVSPEPASKLIAGAMTLSTASRSFLGVRSYTHSSLPALQGEFDKRSAMVKSWQHFQ